MRIGRTVGLAIGWIALVGCEPREVALRGGEPPAQCAGPEQASCPVGQMCIDLPDDDCDPDAGDVDCDGICVARQCAGILGLSCADGLVCVDDPGDDCDPEGDGEDCPGLCVEPEDPWAPAGACAGAGRVYFGTDQASCQRGFACEAGMVRFADGCGCGCEPG